MGRGLELDDRLRCRGRRHSEFALATVHAGLGDLERAFQSLEKCYAERDGRLFWLPVDPRFEPLRSDPRYHDLWRRVGQAAHPPLASV